MSADCQNAIDRCLSSFGQLTVSDAIDAGQRDTTNAMNCLFAHAYCGQPAQVVAGFAAVQIGDAPIFDPYVSASPVAFSVARIDAIRFDALLAAASILHIFCACAVLSHAVSACLPELVICQQIAVAPVPVCLRRPLLQTYPTVNSSCLRLPILVGTILIPRLAACCDKSQSVIGP